MPFNRANSDWNGAIHPSQNRSAVQSESLILIQLATNHSVAKGASSSGLLLVVGEQPVKTESFHGGKVEPIRRAAVDGRTEDLLASDLGKIIREASVLKWLYSTKSGQQVTDPRLAA